MKAEGMHPLFARQLIEQICMGLVELKKKALIHRDLKT
jgi:serine/threonine protein kinase